eukprot:5858168-Pyramimonas_sp.AAC.1
MWRSQKILSLSRASPDDCGCLRARSRPPATGLFRALSGREGDEARRLRKCCSRHKRAASSTNSKCHPPTSCSR